MLQRSHSIDSDMKRRIFKENNFTYCLMNYRNALSISNGKLNKSFNGFSIKYSSNLTITTIKQ